MASRKSHHDARSLSTARPARGRRKLLKSALLGGGAATALYAAPERWTRPVIEAVSLPAHAQTSLELGEGPWAGGGSNIGMTEPFRNRNMARRIVDTLLPTANAGAEIIPIGCGGPFTICIERTGNNSEIRVRSGFMGCEEDSRKVTVSNDLKFDFSVAGSYTVNGKYNSATDRWQGAVTGACDLDTSTSPNSNPASTVFTGESVQVASASEQTMMALVVEPSGFNIEWSADRGTPCALETCF